MLIRVSSPGNNLREGDIDTIEKDLGKIARRLRDFEEREEATAEVRVKGNEEGANHEVTLELSYGRHHHVANAAHGDVHQAVRQARDEVLRQINSRSRGGHSSFAKGR